MPARIDRRQLVAGASAAVPLWAFGLTARPAGAQDATLAADQTLRLASWSNPSYLRPQNEGGPLRMMTQNTFLPPFIEDENGDLFPGLCTDWTVSDDGLVYTLTLDSAAVFSDGSPVTAADLKFSWEYLCWPSTATWSSSYVAGPILGYADVVSGATEELEGLEVIDDHTLQVTLSLPFTPFIKSIATFIAGVVNKDQVTNGDDTWDTAPINCGPYKLESWNKDSGEISWVVNEHWWGETPTITNVNYTYVQDPNTQGILYENDEIDILHPSDILSGQFLNGPQAEEMKPIPYGGVIFFVFNTTRAPMDDVNVRRALLQAVDMGTIVQAVFGGAQTAAFGLISPNLSGYSDPQPTYNPDAAREALAASSYGSAENLPPITIRVPTNLTEYVRVSEAIQQMWSETLGINADISLFAQGEEREDGTSQVFRISLGTLFSDTSASVSALGLSTGSFMTQYAQASVPEIDEILIQADTMPFEEQAARDALYQQAEQMLIDQAFYLPIIWVQYYFAVKPKINNYASNSSLSLYTLQSMTISE